MPIHPDAQIQKHWEHLDLDFFLDIDVVLLVFELPADELPLAVAGDAVPLRARLSAVLGRRRQRRPLPAPRRMAGRRRPRARGVRL
jgi:hypothetical protein